MALKQQYMLTQAVSSVIQMIKKAEKDSRLEGGAGWKLHNS